MSKTFATLTILALLLTPTIALADTSEFDPSAYTAVTPPSASDAETSNVIETSDANTFDFSNTTSSPTTDTTSGGGITDSANAKTTSVQPTPSPSPTTNTTLPPLPLFNSAITLTKKSAVAATHGSAPVVNIPAGDGALHASFWGSVKGFFGIPEASFSSTEKPLPLATPTANFTVDTNGRVVTTHANTKRQLAEVGPGDAATFALALAVGIGGMLARTRLKQTKEF